MKILELNIGEEHIKVTRTARYYKLGEISGLTQNVWVVLHGHKQLAGRFIKIFHEFTERGDLVIAPEALLRFYVEGDYGDVGATWMTKEDRESDIADYVNYLDELYEKEINTQKEKFDFKVTALGFSQGAATLSRWLVLGRAKVDKAIFWCGNIANDVDYSKSQTFKSTEIQLVFGSNDPYFPGDYYKTQVTLLEQNGIKSKVHIFEGEHEISMKLIKEASETSNK